MKFFRIEMLFFIWVVPFLLVVIGYGIKKREKILLKFASLKSLAVITPDVDHKRRYIKALLLLFAISSMIISLAGPQYGYRWQEVERRGIDIIIALDCSKSMLVDDILPTRLDRAKREVFDLLNLLKGDRVGLVAFAGTAFLQCPLTLDYEAFNVFMNVLTPGYLPVGGTDIAAAIDTASKGFNEKDNSQKAIILITDGESTQNSPVDAAKACAKIGIKIFCIGIGNQDGIPIKDENGGFKKDESENIVLAKLDEETLKKIAAITGGTYVRSVAGSMDLDIIYNKEIRGKMDKSTLSSSRKQVWEDRYQWFLFIAIIALIIELFLPSVKKKAAILMFIVMVLWNQPSYAISLIGDAKKGTDAYDKKDYKTALKHLIDAQLKDPERPEIFYDLGNTYYKMGEFEQALKNYKSALKTQDNKLKQKTYYNLGNSSYKKGDFKESIASYNEALKLDPNDEESKENLEFVKKVMEQKEKEKKDQEQNKDKDNKNNEEKKDQDSKDDKSDKDKNNDKKDDKSENQSSKKPEDKEDKKSDQNGTMDKNKQDKDQKEIEQKNAAQLSEDKDKNGKDQAELLLNRLKDMPGKANTPSYEKRNIEKDW